MQVALRQQRLTQLLQVEIQQIWSEQFQFHTLGHVGGQRLGIKGLHVVLGGAGGDAQEAQRLSAQVVAQQASSDVGIVGFLLDHGPGSYHQRGAELFCSDAVVEIFERLVENLRFAHVAEFGAGLADNSVQAIQVQRRPAAVGKDDRDVTRRGLGCW